MLFYAFPVENEVRCRLEHPLFLLYWKYNVGEMIPFITSLIFILKMSHLSDMKLTG